jgi:hypothetical protein
MEQDLETAPRAQQLAHADGHERERQHRAAHPQRAAHGGRHAR